MYSWRISFIRFREYIQIKGAFVHALLVVEESVVEKKGVLKSMKNQWITDGSGKPFYARKEIHLTKEICKARIIYRTDAASGTRKRTELIPIRTASGSCPIAFAI